MFPSDLRVTHQPQPQLGFKLSPCIKPLMVHRFSNSAAPTEPALVIG